MRLRTGMLAAMMFFPVFCTADTVNDGPIAPDVTLRLAPPTPAPMFGHKTTPEALPSPRFADFATPTPSPVQRPGLTRSQRKNFFATNRDSKLVSLGGSLLHLVLLVAAVVIFTRTRKTGDPMLGVARNMALVLVAMGLVVAFLRTTRLQTLHLVIVGIEYCVVFPFLIAAIYTGHGLWRKSGLDYWGIVMWKKERGKLIGISLMAIAASMLYTQALFSATHPAAGWASSYRRFPPGVSPEQKLAISLLTGAAAAIIEEILMRGCFQAMFYKWFGGTQRGAFAAILATSAVWAVGHTGSLSPDWVKYMQIFPMGLLLGFWYQRAGLAGTIAVHLGFNLIVILFPFYLP